jgi:hypothetical protein
VKGQTRLVKNLRALAAGVAHPKPGHCLRSTSGLAIHTTPSFTNEVGRWRSWRGQRNGRRGRRRTFWRIELARGARTKSGVRRQGQVSRSREERLWGWQEAGWASEGWCVGGLGFGRLGAGGLGVSEKWANNHHDGMSRAMAVYVARSVGLGS